MRPKLLSSLKKKTNWKNVIIIVIISIYIFFKNTIKS